MPTLTAPAAARIAAKDRGLVLPAAPTCPNKKKRQAAERREKQRLAREQLWPLLRAVFPEVFRLPAVPLAIGIHKQILDVACDSIDPGALAAFLRYWIRRWSYLYAVWRGEPRRNIDGSVAGVPTVDQRNAAGRWLWGSRHRPIPESTDEPAITPETPQPAAAAATE